jgi:pimeloyl-ACP methyl ester carboxylesterase
LPEPSYLTTAGRRLAYHQLAGRAPAVLFCGGYTSDMSGTKALALERWCRAEGRGYVRFDYSGHGRSGGRFEDDTIGDWAADALAIVDRIAGPLIVVGSSMGGWIMLLVALARPERVQALVGIAAAPDFTEDLRSQATADQRRDLARQGFWLQPSSYGEAHAVTAGCSTTAAGTCSSARRSRSPARSTCCTASRTRTYPGRPRCGWRNGCSPPRSPSSWSRRATTACHARPISRASSRPSAG